MGSNTYGTKKRVLATSHVQSGIAVSVGARRDSVTDLTIRWSMSAAEAMSIKQYLRIALICKQTSEGVTKYDTYAEPEFRRPEEIAIKWQYLFVTDVHIWVFDTRTGKILAKEAVDAPK